MPFYEGERMAAGERRKYLQLSTVYIRSVKHLCKQEIMAATCVFFSSEGKLFLPCHTQLVSPLNNGTCSTASIVAKSFFINIIFQYSCSEAIGSTANVPHDKGDNGVTD